MHFIKYLLTAAAAQKDPTNNLVGDKIHIFRSRSKVSKFVNLHITSKTKRYCVQNLRTYLPTYLVNEFPYIRINSTEIQDKKIIVQMLSSVKSSNASIEVFAVTKRTPIMTP